MNYEIDDLDRDILMILQKDSRKPFQLIAKQLFVSGGTVHVRYNKLKEMGVIKGNKLKVNYEKIGFDIIAFIGINLHKAVDYMVVVEKIRKIPEVLEAHYTTGKYNIFIKIVATSTKGLQHFLIGQLHNIPQIQSTETLISLERPIYRDVPIKL